MLLKPLIYISACITLSLISLSSQATTDTWELPRRSVGAKSGSAFLSSLQGLSSGEVENKIFQEIASGNVPRFLRKLLPVKVALKSGGEATVFVTADYLGVGDGDDFVRLPMSLDTAQKLAKTSRLSLPNRAIVDAIYNQASFKLAPKPLPPIKGLMVQPSYWAKHSELLRSQLKGRIGQLTAGHKKDILLPTSTQDRRLTIYGWHRGKGRPIQPESRAHGRAYVDYSHGVRLVSDQAIVNGRLVPLQALLRDANGAHQAYEIDRETLW